MNEDSLREAFSKYGEVVESKNKNTDLFRVLVYVIAVVCMVLLLT